MRLTTVLAKLRKKTAGLLPIRTNFRGRETELLRRDLHYRGTSILKKEREEILLSLPIILKPNAEIRKNRSQCKEENLMM